MNLNRWGLGLALLVLGAGSAVATPQDDLAKLEGRLKELQHDWSEARAAYSKLLREAPSPAERVKLFAVKPWTAMKARARLLADDAGGTEVGAQTWGMIFLNADRERQQDELWESFQILIEDYPNSPALLDVVDNVQYAGEGQKEALQGLRRLLVNTSQVRTQAACYLSLAKLLEKQSETYAEATSIYRLIIEKYADEKSPRGDLYGVLAKTSLFEAENLQLGMRVPDFESRDETGTAFKLSDYQGKVLLLDFWGFW